MPQSFQLVDEIPGPHVPVPLAEIVLPQFFIGRPGGQEMPGNRQDRIRDRHDRFLMSPVPHDAAVPRGKTRVPVADGRQSTLVEDRAKPPVSLPGLARLMFARTFIVAGTQAGQDTR